MSDKRILLIVESPNKVASLKSFLPKNYIVMASVGHITEIKDSGKYWNTGIDPEANFEADYVVSKDKKDIVKSLKEQVKLADEVILASDPDREGEAIAWSLKKFLSIPEKKYFRVTFHEITKNAVLKALENPRKIDYDLVNASHARQKLDKLLGYRLSPIAKKQVGAKSVGRCQSAGLELIVHLEKIIQDFVPVHYGDLKLIFNKGDTEFKAKYVGTLDKEVKQPSVEECEKVIEDCLKCDKIYVSNITTKERNSYPKPPFTTSTFLQEVTSKLNVSVDQATKYAQKLFEGLEINGEHIALITYIRTDSAEFAPEFIPILKEHVLNTYGKSYYAPLREVKKADNVQDGHEAIRPVDLSRTPDMVAKYLTDKNLAKVYEIIYRRTVATMMAPSVTSETVYTISCGKHIFKITSKELLFDGFKKVYTYKDKEDDETSDVLELNYIITRDNKPRFEIEEKDTTPPSRYKESTFIKELETSGIGRPSTFSTIVNTLKDKSRGYCTIEDNYIVPTEKGIELSDFLESNNIINIDYTSFMEKELDEIANAKLNEVDFLRKSLEDIEHSVEKFSVKQKEPAVVAEGVVCPNCGSPMILRKSKYGPFYGCSKFPKCKGVLQVDDKQ